MDLSETNVVLSGGNEGLVVSIVSGLAPATIVLFGGTTLWALRQHGIEIDTVQH